jgi:hypothetical protein
MISNKYLGIVAVVMALGVVGLSPSSVRAEENAPGDQNAAGDQDTAPDADSAGEAVSHRSPIRLNSVDYQDTNDGTGKLTIDGIGLPGNEVYVFLDDQPLAKALPDDGGKWSVESGTKLDEGKHTLRADQYDPTTQMLAARAMVSIQRANPGSGEAPADSPPPKATP